MLSMQAGLTPQRMCDLKTCVVAYMVMGCAAGGRPQATPLAPPVRSTTPRRRLASLWRARVGRTRRRFSRPAATGSCSRRGGAPPCARAAAHGLPDCLRAAPGASQRAAPHAGRPGTLSRSVLGRALCARRLAVAAVPRQHPAHSPLSPQVHVVGRACFGRAGSACYGPEPCMHARSPRSVRAHTRRAAACWPGLIRRRPPDQARPRARAGPVPRADHERAGRLIAVRPGRVHVQHGPAPAPRRAAARAVDARPDRRHARHQHLRRLALRAGSPVRRAPWRLG